MNLLFETYYTDVINFSREMYNNLLNSDPIAEGDNIAYMLSEDPVLDIVFIKTPEPGLYRDLAGFYGKTKGKRSTVTLKNGKKARRVLIEGGLIAVNVANVLQKHRRDFPFYREVARLIEPTEQGGFRFSDALSSHDFAIIVNQFIKTVFFKHIFAHEIQHFYNPWVHKRAESHRKVNLGKPLTRKQQLRINYIRSNAEVDSRTVEAAVGVMNALGNAYLFEEDTPDHRERFVNACKQFLTNDNHWREYSPKIQDKMVKRWKRMYLQEVQRRSLAGDSYSVY